MRESWGHCPNYDACGNSYHVNHPTSTGFCSECSNLIPAEKEPYATIDERTAILWHNSASGHDTWTACLISPSLIGFGDTAEEAAEDLGKALAKELLKGLNPDWVNNSKVKKNLERINASTLFWERKRKER